MSDRLPDDVLSRLGGIVGAPADPPPPAGPSLRRYELLEIIGEGASGAVWRGRDRELDRPVAVKLLKHAPGDATVEVRFQREAQVAARLSHPNLVPVYDVGEEGGQLYLVMELIQGVSLQDALRDRKLSIEQKVALMEKVARGVSAAHDQGIVHRDLKPANVLIAPDGQPKVGDFGVAHMMESDAGLTRTGTILGTPLYMAPEQVRGRVGEISPRTDVYALGAIFYEMLVQQPPHAGASVTELYGKIISDEPVSPRQRDRSIPRDLDTVTLKALEKAPERRYPTAREFADDLARFLRGEPIQARPPGGFEKLVRKARRHRAVSTGIAVALLAVIAGAAVIRDADRTARRRKTALTALELHREEVDRIERLLDRAPASGDVADRQFELLQEQIARIIAGSPDVAQARHLLARVLELRGQDDLARASWRKAVEIDPGFAPSRYQLGHSLMMQVVMDLVSRSRAWRQEFRPETEKRALEAANEIEAAVRSGAALEGDLQRELASAIVLYARGDVEGVRATARQAIERFPAGRGIEEMHLLLGLVSTVPVERVAELTAAIDRNPRHIAARFVRGVEHAGLRQWDRSRGDLDVVIRLSPRLAAAWANRAVAVGELGDPAAAVRDCTQAVTLDPLNTLALCNRAAALHRLGRIDEALVDAEEALRINPENPLAYSGRAGVRAQQGDMDGAFADCVRSIELAPARASPWSIRAGIWNSRQNHQEAEKDATKAIELDPLDAGAFINRGMARALTQKLDAGLADYDVAVKLDPHQPLTWFGRARVHQLMGRREPGLADVRRALEVAPPEWPTRSKAQILLDQLLRLPPESH